MAHERCRRSRLRIRDRRDPLAVQAGNAHRAGSSKATLRGFADNTRVIRKPPRPPAGGSLVGLDINVLYVTLLDRSACTAFPYPGGEGLPPQVALFCRMRAQDVSVIVTDALCWPVRPFPYFYYLPLPPPPPTLPPGGIPVGSDRCRRALFRATEEGTPCPLNRGTALPIRRGWGTAPRPSRTAEDGWGCPGKVRKACGARLQKPPTTNQGSAADCNICVTLDNYPGFRILRL